MVKNIKSQSSEAKNRAEFMIHFGTPEEYEVPEKDIYEFSTYEIDSPSVVEAYGTDDFEESLEYFFDMNIRQEIETAYENAINEGYDEDEDGTFVWHFTIKNIITGDTIAEGDYYPDGELYWSFVDYEELEDEDEEDEDEEENQLSVSIETITPEDATKMIALSEQQFISSVHQQRNTRKRVVENYAEIMRSGNWRLNGETLKFTEDGRCVDGLHRLSACILSNTPFTTVVIRNVPIDTIPTIDMNTRRSTEDLMKMVEKECLSGAAQIVKQKMTLDRHCKHRGASNTNSGFNEFEKLEEYEEWENEYKESVNFSNEIYKTSGKIIKKAEAGAMYMHLVYTLGWSKNDVSDWMLKLASSNSRYEGGSYIEKTKYQLLKDGCRGAKRTDLFICCWNSYVKNRKNLCKNEEWFIANTHRTM